MEHRRLPPIFALSLAALAFGMLAPAGLAAWLEEWRVARAFLFSGIGTGFAAAILGVALAGARRLPQGQGELGTLLAVWVLLPPFAALPLYLATPQIGYNGAWFEMMAAFTTTGGTVYAQPERVSIAIHLWRGMVAWYGGLVTLTAAFAILAPRNLGGFEVIVASGPGAGAGGRDMGSRLDISTSLAPPEERILRALRSIMPVYFTLTIVLALIFDALGQGEIVGLIHAMAILSTSGISPFAGGLGATPNIWAEVAAAVFLVLAATRLVYARANQLGARHGWIEDPELRMMAALVLTASGALFLRHWLGAFTVETGGEQGIREALTAIWGGFFTALSYLTTTGFASGYWDAARSWSGLSNPGLVLIGLCAIGGGAATTAGGIKLIRAFALLRHGVREIDRLAQPNVVLGVGTGMRGLLRQGAFIAWAFIMLYIIAIYGITIALALRGMPFETALIAAVSAITNTGPALTMVMGEGASFGLMEADERAILAVGMVLGRVETLVVIALFSPDVWRALRGREKSAGKPGSVPPKSGW